MLHNAEAHASLFDGAFSFQLLAHLRTFSLPSRCSLCFPTDSCSFIICLGLPLFACVYTVCLRSGLADMCAPITRDFEDSYGKYFSPVIATLKQQALHTTDGKGARLDWVITAKVNFAVCFSFT